MRLLGAVGVSGVMDSLSVGRMMRTGRIYIFWQRPSWPVQEYRQGMSTPS